MSSTAVQYAGALRHTGCTLSDLQHTADYLTDCAPLWMHCALLPFVRGRKRLCCPACPILMRWAS